MYNYRETLHEIRPGETLVQPNAVGCIKHHSVFTIFCTVCIQYAYAMLHTFGVMVFVRLYVYRARFPLALCEARRLRLSHATPNSVIRLLLLRLFSPGKSAESRLSPRSRWARRIPDANVRMAKHVFKHVFNHVANHVVVLVLVFDRWASADNHENAGKHNTE